MKLLLIFLLFTGSVFAQSRINSFTKLKTFSLSKLDSEYTKVGIPNPQSVLGLKYEVSLYKVNYKSRDYYGNPENLSGLVIVPNVDYCGLPLASYMHGTIVEKECVPSNLCGSEYLIGMALASGGMIVTLPDYHGLGDGAGIHPYQNARTEAFSSIDLLFAAKELKDSLHYGLSKQLFLMGYSQGGHATMATHKMIEEAYTNEFTITASAPMSGAYSMNKIMVDVMLSDSVYPTPYYLPYLIIGNNPIYKFYPSPDSFLMAPHDTLVGLFDGKHSGGYIDKQMPNIPKKIIRPDQLNNFITNTQNHFFRRFLADNDLVKWVPIAPMNLHYCTGDKSVSYLNAIMTFDTMVALGAKSIMKTNVGSQDHVPCAQLSMIFAKSWFDTKRIKPLTIDENIKYTTSGNTANVTINLYDGLPPYKISWSNGDTGRVVNLINGTYTYIVKDSLCSTIKTIKITTTDIHEITESIVVFPNPLSNYINISSPYDHLSFELVNQLGTVTISETTNSKINIKALPNALYFLKIKDGERVIGVKKIWKQEECWCE
jgi:hypothetical protein